MSDRYDGEALVERADEAVSHGESATLLEIAAGEGEAAQAMESLPGPGALFDAFAYPRHQAARLRLERWFRLVAPPGQPLSVPLRPGDILVRRALGEGGLGHVAIIAAPGDEPLDRALAQGWRVEGRRPGGYVRVVEAGVHPHALRDRFARRLLEPGGWLPPDTLVLRPTRGGSIFESEGAGEDVEQAAPTWRLPAGKGLWTGNLEGAGTPAQMAARMRANHIAWLAVHVLEIGGERRNPRRILERYFTALRGELTDPAPGFWLWGWPRPGGHEAFVPALVTAATEVGAQGVIIDVEAAWKWPAGNAARQAERREQARVLMAALLPAAHDAGLSVGFTSYGAPWFHRRFPWEQFTGADFSLPQIYDAENTADLATFAPRCDREWRAYGFRALMPISNAYNKSAEQMRQLLQHTPVTEGAISWWWWHAAGPTRLAVIRDYAIPARTSATPATGTEASEEEDVHLPFLEELEAAEAGAFGEMQETSGPVVHSVGRVVSARRFVDMPLTYEEWIDNADSSGIVMRRTRCDTLAHVTAHGQLMPLGDDGVNEFAISHADLITSLSAVPMLWQTGTGGRLQVALDLVICYPADPADADRLPPGREKYPLVVVVMGNHGVCTTTPTGTPDPPTGAMGPGGMLPLRLFHTATFGAEILSHHGYSAVTRGRPPGVTTGPASVPYLQEELAAHGMISVSVSTNPANYLDSLVETRADLVLKAVAEMRRLNALSSSRFYRRVDFDRVAFVGHSRGGDAVVRAAHKQRSVNVRAVVQLAPTDLTGLLRGRAPAGVAGGRTDVVTAPMTVPASLDAFHLLIYGSRDGDVSGLQDVRLSETGEAFRHYDRSSAHRSFLFWHGATHNRFNRFWEDADEEPLVNLAAGGLLGRPEQERRTSEMVGACLRFVLNREAAQADRLNGRTPSTIAPGNPVAAMWKFGRTLKTIDRFEDVRADRNTLGGRNVPPVGGLVDEIVMANENPPNAGILAFQFMHVDRVLRGSLPSAPAPGTGGALTSGRWRAQIPSGDRDFRSFTVLTLRVTKKYDPAQIAAGHPAATLMPAVRVRLVDAAGATSEQPATGRLSALPDLRTITIGANTLDLTKFHFETWEVELASFTGVNRGRVAAVEVEMSGLGGQPVYVDTLSLVRL